jgi:hypothetical protein
LKNESKRITTTRNNEETNFTGEKEKQRRICCGDWKSRNNNKITN